MGMPVAELLSRISSRELTEWAIYEKENGALGPEYERQMLREIHYAQQLALYQWGGSKTEKGKTNPISPPKYLPKPNEWQDQDEEQE